MRWFPKLFKGSEKRQATFFLYIFSMASKLTKSDGQVTVDEIKAIQDFMDTELKLNVEQKTLAIQIFRKAKSQKTNFQYYARHYHHLFKNKPSMLENAIELLIAIAFSDGNLCSREERLMRTAVDIFGIPRSDYQQLKLFYIYSEKNRATKRNSKQRFKNQYQQGSATQRNNSGGALAGAYATLGCSPSDSKKTIKKKYRKLVLKYHPDRMIAKGIPPEMIQVANDKFLRIQQAYETISKK